jgi:hypothetical protein
MPLQDYGCFMPEDPFAISVRQDVASSEHATGDHPV